MKSTKKKSDRLSAFMGVALMVMVTFYQNTAIVVSKPGLTSVIWAPCQDIATYPTLLTTAGAGDSVTLDPAADYTFTGATGFIDLQNELFKGSSLEWKNSGDEASPNWGVSLKGMITGLNPKLIEMISRMVGQPGILIVTDSDGSMWAVGDKLNPAYVMWDGKTDFLNGSGPKGNAFEFKCPAIQKSYSGTPVMHP